MAPKKIQIEGVAEFGGNEQMCVCGHCGNNERENATIEFNFKECKIFFYCPQCKKMNEIFFGQNPTSPLPKIRLGR